MPLSTGKTVKRIEIRVFGFVQGVGFRAYTRRRALELNLKGFAKNERDGSVYIVAEGEEGNLMKLLGAVKKGPGRVESVEYKITEATGEFKEFYTL
jgi:acylphosphatase